MLSLSAPARQPSPLSPPPPSCTAVCDVLPGTAPPSWVLANDGTALPSSAIVDGADSSAPSSEARPSVGPSLALLPPLPAPTLPTVLVTVPATAVPSQGPADASPSERRLERTSSAGSVDDEPSPKVLQVLPSSTSSPQRQRSPSASPAPFFEERRADLPAPPPSSSPPVFGPSSLAGEAAAARFFPQRRRPSAPRGDARGSDLGPLPLSPSASFSASAPFLLPLPILRALLPPPLPPP